MANAEDEAPKMVFTKPLDVEDAKLTYFEIVEPSSLRYIFRARPSRNFGATFVSCALLMDQSREFLAQQFPLKLLY